LELPTLECVRVPRWLRCSPGDDIEVHGFADASERAYAAVVYLRTRASHDQDDEWRSSLVMAKTKVAPLKQISLPRLELCAATLLVRLVKHIRSRLILTDCPVHLWSDSTVTLGWIKGHPTQWKTFVANRVSEIQTTLPDAQWRHIPGCQNPADCASRGISPSELVHHPLWWRGPAWRPGDLEILKSKVEPRDELPERKSQSHVGVLQSRVEEPELLTRHSSLERLLWITAWCRRWLTRRAAHQDMRARPRPLTPEEIDQGLLTWVRLVQAAQFKDVVRAMTKGASVGNRRLAKLTPFLDEHGALRVGGRMKHALLAYDERHPIILPSKSHLTSLLIGSCHLRVLHGGVQQTLGLLRQRFWILGERSAVKAHLHRCVKCVRWRAASTQQLMGDLPAARVIPSRPFEHSGVDYAGPIMLRATRGRGHKASKAFIVIFVCFSTRAVHLDVVSDYTAEAFLATLRRFVSRRGIPQVLYSDCGTNFTGAAAKLRKLFTASSRESQRIGRALAEEHIKWKFNPPAAPHFGGLWEAAVKSVKHHLRRVIGDATLTYEEMATFLAEVEACLNSRPLAPLSDDPEDLTALTPGHFLIGNAINAVPEPTFLGEPINHLTRWQQIQSMRDHFWRRWSQEYLHSLTARPKWTTIASAPRVGQLCLVRSETTPPTRWPLARILELHPGDDCHVRVATVRTATSRLIRPLVKLILLPVNHREEVPTSAE